MAKTTSREEALKRIISQKEYDRIVEENKEWDAEEAQRNYRLLYVKKLNPPLQSMMQTQNG